MTKKTAIDLVKTLGLEPVKEAELVTRIEREGVTDEVQDEVQEMVQKKIDLTEAQDALIEEAIKAVEETDAEVAKIVAEAEEELKTIEKEETAKLEELAKEEADDAGEKPVQADPVEPQDEEKSSE